MFADANPTYNAEIMYGKYRYFRVADLLQDFLYLFF